MKFISILNACCAVAIFGSGCATTTFALREREIVPHRYRAKALFENKKSELLVEGAGPLPADTPTYFCFNSVCNQKFREELAGSNNPHEIAKFITTHEVGLEGEIRRRPSGYSLVAKLPSNLKDGIFVSGAHDVPKGYKHLNAIWTVPVDVVTAPLQIVAIGISIASGFHG